MQHCLILYRKNDMKLLLLLSKIFRTRSSSGEAHKLKNKLTAEGLKTSYKMNKVNRALQKNITITHNIAVAQGVFRNGN